MPSPCRSRSLSRSYGGAQCPETTAAAGATPSRAVTVRVIDALPAARKFFGATAALLCSVYRLFSRVRQLCACILTISHRLTPHRGDPCTRARFKSLPPWLGVSNS